MGTQGVKKEKMILIFLKNHLFLFCINNKIKSQFILFDKIPSLQILNIRRMGSSNVKDENIDLYLEVEKPYYMAGQFVEGNIYLNAKQTRQYVNLVVRLTGEEHVYWSQGSGKNRRSYSNSIQNYDSLFIVFNFGGTVNQGHYSFPFSFLLPNTMSGSYNYSDSCYIRYTLKVIMNHPSKEKESQIYSMYLNIMQPPRMPLGASTIQNTTHAKCCGCCKDYGNTTINLKCDKNFAFNGDIINIEGSIDNSGGNSEIESGRVTLEQKRVVISSGGSVRYRNDQSTPFGTIRKINPGQTEHFHFSGQIPVNTVNYTAIGRCTARYFLIGVYTEMGCCANQPFAAMHIIINTKTPSVMKQQKMQPPNGWYPQEHPKVVCNNMKPFIYQPLPGIIYKNSGEGVTVMQNQNGGMQPYFGENQGQYNQGEYNQPYYNQNGGTYGNQNQQKYNVY